MNQIENIEHTEHTEHTEHFCILFLRFKKNNQNELRHQLKSPISLRES